MLKLSKKTILPIIIGILLLGIGIGGYFLFKYLKSPTYQIDRYPELLEYCDTETSEKDLIVSCKALMLNLEHNAGVPKITSLIITNSEELKEYTITEKEEVFTFTNDILQFKKLKPVIINIQYTKINPIKYGVKKITFEDIPETYIQEIVNRDIEEIMGMDRNSTTILNSFDFCPRPETLPDYIVKKEEYTKYWKENILKKEDYQNEKLYTTTGTEIKILFGCDSQKNLGYLDECKRGNVELGNDLRKLLKSEPKLPEWDIPLESVSQAMLKQISFLYDGRNLLPVDSMPLLQKGEDFYMIKNTSDVLTTLVDWINSEVNINEDVFCGTVKLLNDYNDIPEVQNYITNIYHIFSDNFISSSSVMCSKMFNNNLVDYTGLYFKNTFNDYQENIKLYNRCINLEEYIR